MSDLVFHFTDSKSIHYRFELYKDGRNVLCVKTSCDWTDDGGYRYGWTMSGAVIWETETLPDDARQFLGRVIKNLAFA